MRLSKTVSLLLACLVLTGCSTSAKTDSASPNSTATQKPADTVESLIAQGCEKYLASDSKGASADFTALAKLDSTYKDVETANSDIAETMDGVTTVQGITDMPEKDRQRVYESILTMENLCGGVDAP